jgi:hypothetical protein
VPVRTTDRFKTAVTFDMPGATWDYVNSLHALYRFHENWPYGMLCHITGEVDSGIRSVGLWLDRTTEQEYFRRVALEVITDSIHEIGPPPVDPSGNNFEPRAIEVTRVAMTDACRPFADIGSDADGSAIHVLDTEPVILSIPKAATQFRPFAAFDPEHEAPGGLIIAWDTSDGNEHQVWASKDHAMKALAEHKSELEIFPLKRISFGSSELNA